MLREKLKGRLLKPLLFLLALFAIQQTASAYDSYQFRSKDGKTGSTMKWNPATKAYETTLKVAKGAKFGVFCSYNNSGNEGNSGNEQVDNTPAIYILDNTGWDELAVYIWGNGDSLGGWPGKVAETVEINGVTYKKVEIPTDASGGNHVIFNNNDNGEQVDGPEIPFGRSY
ncbi:MAG: starch-binding protein, partial [Muribaculaceae bacterium]|nr:starch-binding protein [Muribaculaceae bacterium]